MLIYQEGNTIYIRLEGNEQMPSSARQAAFTWNGETYYYGRDRRTGQYGFFFYEYTNREGEPNFLRRAPFVRFEDPSKNPAFGRVQLLAPLAARGKPLPMWGRARNFSPSYSWHIDQMRFVRVTAFVSCNKYSLDIPLLDADGAPYCSPEVPPLLEVRHQITVTDDLVTAPSTSGREWSDKDVNVRPLGGSHYTPARIVNARVRPSNDPVPHWILRIEVDTLGTTGTTCTILCDMLTTGSLAHAASFREVGSAGVVGHYKIDQVWAPVDWGANITTAIINERKFCTGAIDVANDPSFGGTGTIYLTTGANEGLATGTDAFTILPMCPIFGHAELGTYVAGSAETDWKPESWGRGREGMPSTVALPGPINRDHLYWTTLFFDPVSGRYAVKIRNAANDGTGLPNAALNRTFFAQAWGK